MLSVKIPKPMEHISINKFFDLGRSLNNWGSRAAHEEKLSWRYLEAGSRILDVACGIGNFISVHPNKTVGIDINEESIKHCRTRGYDARLGNALDLPFDDNIFDGVHSAHVMHAFSSQQAIRYLSELIRVVRPQGTIVISNLCDPETIFNYPEVSRPYPPEALFRMLHASTSPKSRVGTEIAGARFHAIHFRRPPLVQFRFVGSEWMWHAATVLNSLQYGCHLRKAWAFEGYTIVLTKN
ncbi:class I SAM-dependent methyltransferase [Azospirillum doebereinerae]|nr:class I SAM-dependent methyltransferase [Azospirillum doebereinerae]MCG5238786.1 class I SAM-dependent methyltransferase [Azospirillum doebereinerae]